MYLWENIPFFLVIGSLIGAFVMAMFARWKKEWCPYLTIISVGFSFILSCIILYLMAG